GYRVKRSRSSRRIRRILAYGPEGSGLKNQRGRDGDGESLRDAGPLDQQREHEEEGGEGEEPEQEPAQHANGGSRPLEMVRESREDRAVERVRRQQTREGWPERRRARGQQQHDRRRHG